MSESALTSSPSRPLRPGERSGHNMASIIERLAFMHPFNVTMVRDLEVLLALGEEGGVMTFDRLMLRAMIPDAMTLRTVLARLAEKGVNTEASVVVSPDASTITLTNSGRLACNVWNLPLSPLRAVDLPMLETAPTTDPVTIEALKTEHKVRGKVSYFGGPADKGVSPDENLALYPDGASIRGNLLFSETQPAGTTGTARRLKPGMPYIAMRWAYQADQCGKDTNGLGVRLPFATPRLWLLRNMVKVINPKTQKFIWASPVDWGPNGRTQRVADVSPAVMQALGLTTDDEVEVVISLPVEAARHAA